MREDRITDRDVERLARAAYEAGLVRKMNVGPAWEGLEQHVRDAWHEYAQEILQPILGDA